MASAALSSDFIAAAAASLASVSGVLVLASGDRDRDRDLGLASASFMLLAPADIKPESEPRLAIVPDFLRSGTPPPRVCLKIRFVSISHSKTGLQPPAPLTPHRFAEYVGPWQAASSQAAPVTIQRTQRVKSQFPPYQRSTSELCF